MGAAEVPEEFGCQLSQFDDGHPQVEVHWQVVNGAPVCREVRVQATDSGHEVQCSGLAGVRLEDLLERTIRALLWQGKMQHAKDPDRWVWPWGEPAQEAVREVRAARSARRIKVTDELLREVAAVYRENVEDKPTQAVADRFNKSDRTARLYVKQARDRDFLGAAIKGKAGEQ
jgi:hypothetical protein